MPPKRIKKTEAINPNQLKGLISAGYQRNGPARDIAKKPRILEIVKTLSVLPAKPAIIAPTIITDDIALVTDISGVCKDGVTLHTT